MRALVPMFVLLAGPALAQTDADAPVLVQAETQTVSAACAGRGARIEGNHNKVTLDGPCRSLRLLGGENTVSLTLAPDASIRVEGSGNRVTYVAPGAAPKIEALGDDNVVQAAAPVVSQPPEAPAVETGVLDLSGDGQSLATECAGRDVTIHGTCSLYVLRGGCRSLTVDGSLDIVQAEMAPGAKITVDGHGITVSWALADRGRVPVTAVHGEANLVQHTGTIGGLPVR